jgi:TonB-dependent starch-binding outer membrane protein SusC
MSDRVICIVLALTGALLLGGVRPAEAQQLGSVEGRVLDATTSRALSNAEVLLASTGVQTTTDGEGRFRLRNVRPGTYRLEVRYLGHSPRTVDVVVEAMQVTRRDVSLEPCPLRSRSWSLLASGPARRAPFPHSLQRRQSRT